MTDPVLDTLCLPLQDGTIPLPTDGLTLILRARTGEALRRLPRDHIVCDQSFKPACDALARDGFVVRDSDDRGYGLTLILPPRQRDENRALLARAVRATRDGGLVMAAAANQEGARTVESDLKALTGAVTALSKNKCRVFWARVRSDHVDHALVDAWAELDAPRLVADDRFLSRPGLFAWDHIDGGSRLLAEHLPATMTGKVADLGAGFGYLSDEVLTRFSATTIDVIEAEGRALDLARQNLARFGDRATFHWLDATKPLPAVYDAIVSNPPFHVDREDRHDIGRAFITSAAKSLRAGGSLWMVANRHLPYEDTLKGAFKGVTKVAESSRFKVLHAVGPQKAVKPS